MEGAKEYAGLFQTGQYGRLYITSGSHARGSTFEIQVLPENEIAIPNGSNNRCLNKNAVLVYGALGGQLGWTEYYGWIHKGQWVKDFELLVEQTRKQMAGKKNKLQEMSDNMKEKQIKKESELLSTYK